MARKTCKYGRTKAGKCRKAKMGRISSRGNVMTLKLRE